LQGFNRIRNYFRIGNPGGPGAPAVDYTPEGEHGSTIDYWPARVEGSPECEHIDTTVTGSSRWWHEEVDWVTAILTVGDKQRRGDRDEPAAVGSSW
jgi:hypothetical protein